MTPAVLDSLPTNRLLVRVFRMLRAKFAEGGKPDLGDLLRPLGMRSAALGSCLLALPFLWPLSLGPLTIPASVLITMLALQLLRDQQQAPLPAKFLATPIPRQALDIMTKLLMIVLRLRKRIARERNGPLVAGATGRLVCGVGLITGAIVLAVPVPMLPLTNTFPALGIILMALGWVEKDDVLSVLGMLSQFFGAAIILGIFILAWYLGLEVKELLGQYLPWLASGETAAAAGS